MRILFIFTEENLKKRRVYELELEDLNPAKLESVPSREPTHGEMAEMEGVKCLWQQEKCLFEELIRDQREDIEMLSQKHQAMKDKFQEKVPFSPFISVGIIQRKQL